MEKVLCVIGLGVCIAVCQLGTGMIWHVDDSVRPSRDGRLRGAPLGTIQAGIDAATDGDTVLVAQGTYVENIRFNGKNITLTSTDPLNPSVVTNTVIDGNQSGPVVTFSGTEDETCVLSGFTIQNGEAGSGGGIIGGDWNKRSHAMIQNNTILGSAAEHGGGIAYCDGVIENNTIKGNRATGYEVPPSGGSHGYEVPGKGGGVYRCNGPIRNNIVTENHAAYGAGLSECAGTIDGNTISRNEGAEGGGLHDCDGTVSHNEIRENRAITYFYMGKWGQQSIQGKGGALSASDGDIENNVIFGNGAGEVDAHGGGLCNCQGAIESNLISKNWSVQEGGGVWGCNGPIRNNVVVGNAVSWGTGGALSRCHGITENNTIGENKACFAGGGLDACEGAIRNCIVWGNAAPEGSQIYESSVPIYSCIQDWSEGGQGNIVQDPRFVGRENGDFWLRADSPCVDAGYNDPDLPQTDIAGMHRIMFGGKSLTVDMGAYEFYINELKPGPTPDQTTFTWSSLSDKTYSIFYSADLLTWHLAIGKFVSFGGTTTRYTDDGSQTGSPPGLAPRRFYRLLENP